MLARGRKPAGDADHVLDSAMPTLKKRSGYFLPKSSKVRGIQVYVGIDDD
ncbi:MAG: hypothetical protein U0744_04840 [Gemmataceae bacterium]